MNAIKQKSYLIGELAELSGVTVRTIQYYDQIGLLVAKRSESNLRYYTESDLMTLQQILIYKRLDFPLKEIKKLISNVKNSKDLTQILEQQKLLLFQKEMELRMNQIIIEVVQSILESEPETDLEPLMSLVLGLEKQSFMNYTHIEYTEDTYQAMDEGDIQLSDILTMYWNWKEIILEAAALKLNDAEVESQAGYQIGEKWANFLNETSDDHSQIRTVAEHGLEQRNQWPEEDLFLYDYSLDYIETSYQYYLTKRGEFDD